MEHRLNFPRLRLQAPDWLAAIVSGIAAGAVLMVISLLWSATDMTSNPWITARRIAAIVMGSQVMASADFSANVLMAMALTHYGLGVIFATVLAMCIAAMHFDDSPGKVVSLGALFGFLLYLFNFYLLEESFPWFADMRGGATLLAHLIFGMLAAGIYWKLERRD